MRPITRKRRILKWAGLAACGLIVFAFGLSRFWSIGLRWGHYYGAIDAHAVEFRYTEMLGIDRLRWTIRRNMFAKRIQWWPSSNQFSPRTIARTTIYQIPFWMPLALIGIPTILAWRRDRRIPPGHCRKCRYDLTGNESGVCPECGKAV